MRLCAGASQPGRGGPSPVGVGGRAGAGGLDDLLDAEQPEGVALLGRQPGVGDGLVPVLLSHLRQHHLLPRQHILQVPQALKVQIRIHPCAMHCTPFRPLHLSRQLRL